MNLELMKWCAPLALAGVLSACATGPGGGSIYVPAGSDEAPPPRPPAVESGADEPRVIRKSEQPTRAPSYQEEGDALSPAALGLIQKADGLLAAGDARSAIGQLERAQRIAPRSAEVYFGLAEAYMALDQLATAEQFGLKGLSLAGNDAAAQRSGWLLLAEIRRSRGNLAGADQAEARAAAL